MQIVVDIPHPKLSPNARGISKGAQMARARIARKNRMAARLRTAQALQAIQGDEVAELESGDPIRVVITWHPKTARRRDRDNALAHLKHTLDGVADALGLNDSIFRPEPVQILAPDRVNPRVVLWLERASEGGEA